METSSDDEGDSTSLLTKSTLIILVLLPLALYKPRQQPAKILSIATASPPVVQTAIPRIEVQKPKPKKKKKKLYITFDDGPN